MNRSVTRSVDQEIDTATLLTYGFVGSIVATYVAARAILVPLTYDEAATFLRYIDGPAGAVFDFSVATNHWLNTVATRLSYHLFGGAPWALRLPNVVAGLAFLVSAAAIARRTRHRVIGFTGFVLSVTNLYLLDYLALSRGYGLALGLLTGSLFYLLRWRELPLEAPDAQRALRRALWLAAVAVIATFTVLPAFLAVVAVVVLRLAWTRRSLPQSELAAPWRAAIGWRAFAGWLLIAGAFSLLVFANHPVLSRELFLPITVRAVGLTDDQLRQMQVWRVDPSGRRRPLTREANGTWRTDDAREAWGLRVELPVQTDLNLTSLEVTIGSSVYRRDRLATGPWLARDIGSQRTLQGTGPLAAAAPGTGASDRAINWAGDALLWRVAVAQTIGLMAAFAAVALAVAGIVAVAARTGWIGPTEARLVASTVLAVGAFSAAPLYLLRRDAQLYFGGIAGLVPDTFRSIIERSAYGISYAAQQSDIVLAGLAVSGATVVGLMVAWRGGRKLLAPPVTIVALVAIIAAQIAAQHAVLGTPWPTGRTAIFLLPLMLAFVVLAADAFADAVAWARTPVVIVMLLLAIGSAWHALSVANVMRTLDWPHDASMPAVVEAVVDSSAGTEPGVVRLGVDGIYYPVASYYAGRVPSGSRTYAVEPLPVEGAQPEFLFTAQPVEPSTASLVRGFADSSAALWRTRPAAP